MSGRLQDVREHTKDLPDAMSDRRRIRDGGLHFWRPVRKIHGTHRMQDVIFADVRELIK